MSRPVQTEPADAGHDRRVETRHDAASLGEVTARLVGGSAVRLVNFSNRGILVESDTRLLIGARASVRITTGDAPLGVEETENLDIVVMDDFIYGEPRIGG